LALLLAMQTVTLLVTLMVLLSVPSLVSPLEQH